MSTQIVTELKTHFRFNHYIAPMIN